MLAVFRSEKTAMEQAGLEDQEIIHEFLVESHENLARLDQDLVKLEKHPQDSALLSSVFRTIHTIKGACGFLAFSTLERITHQAESLLSQLRDGQRELNPELVSLILETVDATRKVLASIERCGNEGEFHFEDLTERLRVATQIKGTTDSKRSPDDALLLKLSPAPGALAVDRSEAKIPRAPAADVAQKARGTWDGVERRKRPAAEDEEGTRSASAADANIRVGVGLLDKLMDLVGELVLTRNQILQFNAEREDAALNATSQRLNLITSELQEGVMKTRMQPIGVVWHNLPRMVRDMAVSLGKQIEIEVDGADTELDRTILEAIKDPLFHLVRNACDHGIETPEVRLAGGKSGQGTLTLRAYHEGGQVNIEVADDGAGIDLARVKATAVERGFLRSEQVDKLTDREVLNLIFHPGFSTMETVTNLSGRGVGMDVVKSNIEKIGGVVDIFSRSGEGTTIKIRIPLTLAIIPGLVITSGGEQFVIPQVNLLELIRLEGDASGKHIEYVHGTPVYRRRETLLPVTYLNKVLGLKSADATEAVSMVVLQADDQQFGLVVDGISDTQEIVVKPLGKQLKGLTLYAGATIMGDGHIALILDVLGVGQRTGVFGESRDQAHAPEKGVAQSALEQQRLLLFRAGTFERLAVPLSLVARLEEFPLSAIEHAGGGKVVQYRDRILPLVSLRSVLEPEAPECDASADPLQAVVFNDGERMIGMVVDQILDVAEAAVTVRQKSTRKGLLGSAVVGGRVTDFLDLNEVIRATRTTWLESAVGPEVGTTILVADSSDFWRGLIKSALDMAGYIVREASTLEGALRSMETQPANLVVEALDLSKGGSTLVSALRRHPDWAHIPVLAVAESAEQARAFDFRAAGFQDCQAKFDMAADLESIARLVAAQTSAEVQPKYAEVER
jgi:two-component system chemotaxis sensor kinase CheA